MKIFKIFVVTKLTGKHAMVFYVKGSSMQEAVDYASCYLVADLLMINAAYLLEEHETVPEGMEVYPTKREDLKYV